MSTRNFESSVFAINTLIKEGYNDDFQTKDQQIHAIRADKYYHPKDLLIKECFRFEGMTNPADSTVLYAIKAKDGIKGTLLMSYSAKKSHNEQLIQQIPTQAHDC